MLLNVFGLYRFLSSSSSSSSSSSAAAAAAAAANIFGRSNARLLEMVTSLTTRRSVVVVFQTVKYNVIYFQ